MSSWNISCSHSLLSEFEIVQTHYSQMNRNSILMCFHYKLWFFIFIFAVSCFFNSLFLSDLILPAQKCLVLGHSSGYREAALSRKSQVLPKGGSTGSESGSPLWVRIQKVILLFFLWMKKKFQCLNAARYN